MSDTIKQISDHYGHRVQTEKCVEELIELKQSILNLNHLQEWNDIQRIARRPDADRIEEAITNFTEEIADVSNMLDHMMYLYGCREEVERIKVAKLERQLRRIEGEV